MPAPLDDLRRLVDGTRPPPPIATLIGFTLTAVAPGEAVIELAADRQHANPMGALHGGVLCDIDANGVVDVNDVGPFTNVIVEPSIGSPDDLCRADCNVDGSTDGDDIAVFVDLLLGG